MEVLLSEVQANELKKFVFDITIESVEKAKKNVGLDKKFLKQKYMAEWLGVSVNTLKKWEFMGLPAMTIDGVKFFSKEEVSKWLLTYQK